MYVMCSWTQTWVLMGMFKWLEVTVSAAECWSRQAHWIVLTAWWCPLSSRRTTCSRAAQVSGGWDIDCDYIVPSVRERANYKSPVYILFYVCLVSAFSSFALPSVWNPSPPPHHPSPRYIRDSSSGSGPTSVHCRELQLWLFTASSPHITIYRSRLRFLVRLVLLLRIHRTDWDMPGGQT